MNKEAAVQMLDRVAEHFRKDGREEIAFALDMIKISVDIGADLHLLDIAGHWKEVVDLRMAELKRDLNVEQIRSDARKEVLDQIFAKLGATGATGDNELKELWPDLIADEEI